MGFGSKADLEFLVGLSKDPSFDRMMSDLPRDVKKKFRGAYDDIDSQGQRTFSNLAGYAKSALAMAGVGSIAAVVGSRVRPVAELNHGLAVLGRTAQLSASQQDALREALSTTARESGAAKDEQLAALQLLQDRYAVVNELANKGTLGSQMELAGKFANAYNTALFETYDLFGALNKEGIQGDKLVKNLAFLEKASNMGSLGFKELAAVMPELIGAAGGMGQEGEQAVRDVTAMVEGVTTVIKDAERARTYTRGLISRLSADDVGKKLYAQLGVKTKEANGDFRDLNAIMLETIEALKKLSEGERAAKLKDIFGTEESVQAINAIMQGETAFKGILEIEGAGRDFMGFLDEQATDTATGFKRLKETVSDVIDGLLENTGSIDAIGEALENLAVSVTATGKFLEDGIDTWRDLLGLEKDKRSDKELAADSQAQRAQAMTAEGAVAYRSVVGIGAHKKGGAISPEQQAFLEWYAQSHGLEGSSQAKVLRKAKGEASGMGQAGLWSDYADFLREQNKTELSDQDKHYQDVFNKAFGYDTKQAPVAKDQKKSEIDLSPASIQALKEALANQKPPKVEVTVEGQGAGAETPAAGEAA